MIDIEIFNLNGEERHMFFKESATVDTLINRLKNDGDWKGQKFEIGLESKVPFSSSDRGKLLSEFAEKPMYSWKVFEHNDDDDDDDDDNDDGGDNIPVSLIPKEVEGIVITSTPTGPHCTFTNDKDHLQSVFIESPVDEKSGTFLWKVKVNYGNIDNFNISFGMASANLLKRSEKPIVAISKGSHGFLFCKRKDTGFQSALLDAQSKENMTTKKIPLVHDGAEVTIVVDTDEKSMFFLVEKEKTPEITSCLRFPLHLGISGSDNVSFTSLSFRKVTSPTSTSALSFSSSPSSSSSSFSSSSSSSSSTKSATTVSSPSSPSSAKKADKDDPEEGESFASSIRPPLKPPLSSKTLAKSAAAYSSPSSPPAIRTPSPAASSPAPGRYFSPGGQHTTPYHSYFNPSPTGCMYPYAEGKSKRWVVEKGCVYPYAEGKSKRWIVEKGRVYPYAEGQSKRWIIESSCFYLYIAGKSKRWVDEGDCYYPYTAGKSKRWIFEEKCFYRYSDGKSKRWVIEEEIHRDYVQAVMIAAGLIY